MNKLLPVSEEMLNAFVDNELEGAERDRIISLEASNPDVAKAICELRRLKNLVNAAREDEPENISRISLHTPVRFRFAYMAASFLLAVSVVIFSISDQKMPEVAYVPGSIYQDKGALIEVVSKKKNMNLVLHLKTAGSKQSTEILQLLDSVIQTSQRYNNNLQVEVVVSGPGLHLLQEKASNYIAQVSAIDAKHNNVTFIACGKTLQRLQEKTGKNIQVLKQALLVDSGPDWAQQRQEKGWSYYTI